MSLGGVYHRIKLPDLLLEVDAWTGFSRHFTHLQSGDPPILSSIPDHQDNCIDSASFILGFTGGSLEIIEPGPEFLRLSGYGTRFLDINLMSGAVQIGRCKPQH